MPNLLTIRRILRPFRPDQVQGLALWLDASDATTITLDGSNNVSEWIDKSGNGRNAAQAGPTARPSYSSSGQINGINCPTFDRLNDSLVTSSFSLSQPTTIFAVAKADTIDATDQFIFDGVTNRQASFVTSSGIGYFAGTTRNGSSTMTAGTPALISAVFNGASSELRIDGASVSTANPGSNGISGGMRIGTLNLTNAKFFGGQIGEVIVYSGALSTASRQQIEAYLKTKWGTP